jgi:hypothetical protein
MENHPGGTNNPNPNLLGSIEDGAYMNGTDWSDYSAMSGGWMASLGNGTTKGFALPPEQYTYKEMRGIGTNIYAGLLQLVFY